MARPNRLCGSGRRTVFRTHEGSPDAFLDRAALVGTHRRPQPGTGAALAQFLFDAVEMPHLAQQPADEPGCLGERLVELAPDLRPAARQRDLPTSGTSLDEGRIRLVPISLERAREAGGNDVLQAPGPTARLPVKEHVATRTGVGPQVTLPCAAMARFQVGDGRLVHLEVAAHEHARADRIVNGPQPVGGQAHPASESLAGQVHAVALTVNGFLPVERKMIGVLGDEHLREQPCRGQAALLQARRQRRDDRGRVRVSTPHELAPDQPAAQKARRFVVELLAELRSDAAPRCRARLDWFRVEGLLDDRQVLGQAGRAFTLRGWTRRGRFGLQGRLGRCLRLGRRLVLHALQEHLQLGRVELLALSAEESADERVDLLAQERVLTFQSLVGFQQFGFAGSLAQDERDVRSRQLTWLEANA